MIRPLPDDYTPFHDPDPPACDWCGKIARVEFHADGRFACHKHFLIAGPEYVAYTKLYENP